MDDRVVGVLGGGQLGRMMAQAASRLSIPLITLDSASSPASQVSSPSSSHPQFKSPALAHHVGGFDDPHAILAFSKSVDVLTVEIEHVDVQVLKEVRDDPAGGRSGKGVEVWPAPEVVETIQDKFAQKEHLARHGVPVAEYLSIEPDGQGGLEEGVREAGRKLGWPLMVKSRRLAYDGRGNHLVKTESDVASAVKALVPPGQPTAGRLYAEKFAPFRCEIACMVVRSPSAGIRTFAPVETVHRDNICHLVYAPLRKGGPEAKDKARRAAIRAIDSFGPGAVGVFGVELFLMPDGEILVNEIAPRPHNSYHHTLSSTPVSQFTAHLLAILSMPLPPPTSFSLSVPSAAMLNLLGATDGDAGVSEVRTFVRRAATEVEGCSVEWYGKFGCRKGRKLGHVNVVGQSDAEVQDRIDRLLNIMPGQQPTSTPRTGERIISALNPLSTDKAGFSDPRPLVSIIMGSDSDLPTMLAASTVLDHPLFKIPHELTIVSAHRTPRRMYDFAASARSRGVRVIIAGAGGAAHLPGMVAALTTLPVVGVPVKGSTLDGVDSLHSIVQMPRGVPVATVAINNSTNAALLAIRILACDRGDESTEGDGWARGLSEYVDGMEAEVMAKVDKLAEGGWIDYTRAMKR